MSGTPTPQRGVPGAPLRAGPIDPRVTSTFVASKRPMDALLLVDDHGARNFAALHPREGGVDLIQPAPDADQGIKPQPSGAVQLDQHGEVDGRAARAIPT